MPLYEYKCKQCGLIFEKLVLINEKCNGINCPDCAGNEIIKLVSVFGMSTGRSAGENSSIPSSGNSCSGCRKTSCATCR